MSDKLNNIVGISIAFLVGLGILYGIYTWASNGNPAVNVITGLVLLTGVVLITLRLAKGKYPFNNLSNDWQTFGCWIGIAILLVIALMFLSGFGNYASN
jgi:CDP-diglyceride synthetase